MQIVIEIPEIVYERAKEMTEGSMDEYEAIRAIANGTPLTEGFCDLCGNKNSVEYLIHPKMRICSDCSYKIHHCGFVQVKGENE